MFQKGVSGNPAGRPSIPKELKDKAAKEGEGIIQFWIDSYKNTDLNWTYRDKAATNIANYVWGKPRESVDIEVNTEVVETYEETKRKIDELLAERNAFNAPEGEAGTSSPQT